MEADAIIDLADKAARHVRKRFDLQWTREDFEDARQEAATGIVRALRDASEGVSNGYYFRAGAQGATRYAFRRTSIRAESVAERTDGTAMGYPSRGWAQPLEDADFPKLRTMLGRVHRKANARGGPTTRDQLAVARDLIILEGLSRGLSQSEIGARLALPKGHVHRYQQQLRLRLAAIAAEGA